MAENNKEKILEEIINCISTYKDADGIEYINCSYNKFIEVISPALDKYADLKIKECLPNREVEMNRKLQATMIWIADYAYRKANPDTKRDTPSIIYEQVARDFGKFWDSLTPDQILLNKDKK